MIAFLTELCFNDSFPPAAGDPVLPVKTLRVLSCYWTVVPATSDSCKSQKN